MKKSLVGFHFLTGLDPNERNAIYGVGARTMLLLQDQKDQLDAVIDSADFPILRMISGENTRDAYDWREAFTSRGFREYVDYATGKGKLLWVQGPNETGIDEHYGIFEAHRARLLADMGARAVVLNNAVGTLNHDNMHQFWLGFNSVRDEYGPFPYAIGTHSYGYKYMWAGIGPFQGGSLAPKNAYDLPNPRQFPYGTEAWRVGRWQYFDVFPLDVPLFITEAGLDHQSPESWPDLPVRENGEPYGGWRTCIGGWFRDLGVTDWEDFYARQFFWLDAYLRQFKNVLGFTIFGVGPHYDNQFEDYDIGGTTVIWKLLDHIQKLGTMPLWRMRFEWAWWRKWMEFNLVRPTI